MIERTIQRQHHRHAAPSRVVALLRWGLPFVVLGLVALLMIWPQIAREIALRKASGPLIEKEAARAAIAENKLSGATYTDTDDQNRPYTIKAAQAQTNKTNPNAVDLTAPLATLKLSDDARLDASAQTGLYLRDAKKLVARGKVIVTRTEKGRFMRLESDALQVNIADDTAHTNLPVHITSDTMDITGTGLMTSPSGAIVIVTGPAHAIIQE